MYPSHRRGAAITRGAEALRPVLHERGNHANTARSANKIVVGRNVQARCAYQSLVSARCAKRLCNRARCLLSVLRALPRGR